MLLIKLKEYMILTPCKRKNKKATQTHHPLFLSFRTPFCRLSSTTQFRKKKPPKRKIYEVSTIPKEKQEKKDRMKCQDDVLAGFDLPVGNRQLPPKFTDTATRRQHVPEVNFKKFRRNLEFSKKIEIN